MGDNITDNLNRNQNKLLRSVNGSARYLGIETAEKEMGPVDSTLLFVSPSTYQTAMKSVEFQWLYRLLTQTDSFYAERFVRPDDDFLSNSEEFKVSPWSPESYRNVDAFPVWLFYLSWPGEIVSAERLVQRIFQQRKNKDRPLLAGFVTFPSEPFPGLQDLFDVILQPARDKNKGNDLCQVLSEIINSSSPPSNTSLSIRLPENPSDSSLQPIPPVRSRGPDHFVLGEPVYFNEHYRLQSWSGPAFSNRSARDWIDLTDKIIRQTGMENALVGRLNSEDQNANNETLLSYAQRFAARFKNRAVSFSLMNPKPNLDLWQYPDLLDAYRNSNITACFGDISSLDTIPDSSNIHTWLDTILNNHYNRITLVVSAGAEETTVPKRLQSFLNRIESELETLRQENVEIVVQLQPDLKFPVPERFELVSDPDKTNSHEGWPPESTWVKLLHRFSDRLENDQIRVELHLPEHYDQVSSRLETE